MRTYLDCIPCFFKQALEAARLAGSGKKVQKKIIDELARSIPRFPLGLSPPEMGKTIYGTVRKMTRKTDPYRTVKARSNKFALGLYPKLKERVRASSDRLLEAVELAIAGNIIDYGVKNSLNVEKELKLILRAEKSAISRKDNTHFDYKDFKRLVHRAKKIIYLADNAGETVFDRILIEEIKNLDRQKKIVYAVKETPIINDALVEDAQECGIDNIAEIVSSGLDVPGTVLRLCSRQFLKTYDDADMVISKGQGNFEALDEKRKPVFFLFMAKCPVVAGEIRRNVGDIILLYNRSRRR